MVSGIVENVTDTFSRSCVMSIQLLTYLFFLCLQRYETKRKLNWFIYYLFIYYFIFWYTTPPLLKVVSWAYLPTKSCCKVWYCLWFGSATSQNIAWKHGWANSYVKLYFSELGLHNFLSRHKFVWMDWDSTFLGNQDYEQFINWHIDTSNWRGDLTHRTQHNAALYLLSPSRTPP